MNTSKILGILGSTVLLFGLFSPVIRLHVRGPMFLNYIAIGTIEGIFILFLAGITLFFTLTGKFKGLWLTGLVSLILILVTFFNLIPLLNDNSIETTWLGLFETAHKAHQLQWGWAVLFIGAVLIIASAAINDSFKIQEGREKETFAADIKRIMAAIRSRVFMKTDHNSKKTLTITSSHKLRIHKKC